MKGRMTLDDLVTGERPREEQKRITLAVTAADVREIERLKLMTGLTTDDLLKYALKRIGELVELYENECARGSTYTSGRGEKEIRKDYPAHEGL